MSLRQEQEALRTDIPSFPTGQGSRTGTTGSHPAQQPGIYPDCTALGGEHSPQKGRDNGEGSWDLLVPEVSYEEDAHKVLGQLLRNPGC